MITARYAEYEYYDPFSDAPLARLMCITNLGTWHAVVNTGVGAKLRQLRNQFRQAVEHDIAYGVAPREVDIDG